jgi:nicotinamide phosphoribosyltransferase
MNMAQITHKERLAIILDGGVISSTAENPLLATDVYKMGHMEQYAPGTSQVYSYLVARSDKNYDRSVFFSLQYYLDRYLTVPLEPWMADEFLNARRMILGSNSQAVEEKIRALCALGYWPIEIKAVPEGTVMPVKNVLMTMTNTVAGYGWAVGFLESLIIKLWYPTTTASTSFKYRSLVDRYYEQTVDEEGYGGREFAVHDFGYRGDGSEEGAMLTGAAHLLSFVGGDTVPALPFIVRYYQGDYKSLLLASVAASEHSVMCSFGRDDEIGAFEHMLDLYPSGIVSIVSDTFDVYRVLTEFAEHLKPRIMARDGKVVFRPDSGNPEYIICGDPDAPVGSNEWKGAIRILDEVFGSTVNGKGYKVLDPHVGLIYGDGMYYERYERTLKRLEEMGYAASNLVIGVGGILRNHSRDTMGFAIKATYVLVNGEHRDIEKDPITDSGKKSHKGLLVLEQDQAGNYVTTDQVSWERESTGLLKTVYQNGQVTRRYTWTEVRANTVQQ